MLEPDVTTSEVIIMYVGIFAFIFGLAITLLKKNSWFLSGNYWIWQLLNTV